MLHLCFKNLRLSNVGTFSFQLVDLIHGEYPPAKKHVGFSFSKAFSKLSPVWLGLVQRPLDQNRCASKPNSPLKSTEASKFPWNQRINHPLRIKQSEPLLAHIGYKIAREYRINHQEICETCTNLLVRNDFGEKNEAFCQVHHETNL